MKIKIEELGINTHTDHEYIDITEDIQNIINKSEIKEGIVIIYCRHTTAAIVIQENDETIHQDTRRFLLKTLPLDEEYAHSEEGNINATAHIKNQLFGSHVAVPIKDGNLMLGTWQRIFLVELYQPRRRSVVVVMIGK